MSEERPDMDDVDVDDSLEKKAEEHAPIEADKLGDGEYPREGESSPGSGSTDTGDADKLDE